MNASTLKKEFIELSNWLTCIPQSEQESVLQIFVEGYKSYERFMVINKDETKYNHKLAQLKSAKRFQLSADEISEIDKLKANGYKMLSIFFECIPLVGNNDAEFVKKSGYRLLEQSVKMVDDIDSPFTEDN